MPKSRQLAFVAVAVLVSIVALLEDRAEPAVSPPVTRESASGALVATPESARSSCALKR